MNESFQLPPSLTEIFAKPHFDHFNFNDFASTI